MAAFPDRVTRDAVGQLISIDARPINIDRNTDATLSSSIALRFPGPSRHADDPVQFAISLNHQYRLANEILIRPGLPVIDEIGGDSGQSRHNVNVQFGIGKRGMGATIGLSWSGAARVSDHTADASQVFYIKPPVTLNVSGFIDSSAIFNGLRRNSSAKGWKVSLDIQNLLNGYRRVTLAGGAVSAGYSHDEADPLGRTVCLTLRKRL